MRTIIYFGGKEGIQRINFEDKDYGIYRAAAVGDCENHNAVTPPEEHWIWGEEGTMTDPTLTDEQRAVMAGQVETDRVNALSSEYQAIELEALLDGLAGEADSRQRKSAIRGKTFDGAAWFEAEATKIRPKYTKV